MTGKEKRGVTPLYRQISEDIRKDITSGIYEPGEILPSIRDEAKALGVARNTVDSAYQILAEEGYIKSRRGVGYEVLDYRQSFNFEPDRSANGTENPEDSRQQAGKIELLCDFRGSGVLADSITAKSWNQFASKLYNEIREKPERAEPQLKEQIRKYLKRHRGVTCSEQQIFLFRNFRQAVQMIRRIKPHLLYTIPHHEGSMGDHISREEGDILLKRLRDKGVYMIEDDIDSELVYRKRPYATLFEEDTDGRVILTGTFERIMEIKLQIQYVVFPLRMIEENRLLFQSLLREPCHSILELKILEVMMKSDNWENNLRRTNHRYAEKRDMLLEKIRSCFGEEAILYRTESGPEIIASFAYSGDAADFMEKAEEAGLGICARLSMDEQTGGRKLYVTLNYSGLSAEDIETGIDILTRVMKGGSNP